MDSINEKGQTLSQFLAAYNPDVWPKPSVTVDNVIFTLLPSSPLSIGVLLIRRKDHPFIGQWAFPGGFLNMNETLQDAAKRELFEETGLSGIALNELGAFDGLERDPRLRVISIAYYACIALGSALPEAHDDAADAQFFSIHAEKKLSHLGEIIELSLENKYNDRALSQIKIESESCGRLYKKSIEETWHSDLAADHGLMLYRALERMLLCKTALTQMLPNRFTKAFLSEAFFAIQSLKSIIL